MYQYIATGDRLDMAQKESNVATTEVMLSLSIFQ